MRWAISDFNFEEASGGYLLKVTPVSSGSNETDPDMLAIEKKIESLISIPFVLRLDEWGEIVALENEDRYWTAISTALREYAAEKPAADKAAQKEAIEAVTAMYENMPAEARLALLTQSVQPLVDFANTEMTLGEPLSTEIESASPFGGTIRQDVVISLTKVSNGVAHVSVRSSVPRDELARVTEALVTQFARAMTAEKVAEMKAELADLRSFRKDTLADYRVSTVDGMLDAMESTETIEVRGAEEDTQEVTTVTVTRLR